MKFGKYLVQCITENGEPTWEPHFVSYKYLKKLTKKCADSQVGAEEMFADAVNHEYSKAHSFYLRSAQVLQQQVDAVLANGANGEMLSEQAETEMRLHLRDAAVHAMKLSQFAFVNATAIRKGVKKHDKHSRYALSGFWNMQLRRTKFCPTAVLDKVLYRISERYQLLAKSRTAVAGEDPGASKKEFNESFERKSFKAWVEPQNVPAVILKIVEHLPIYLYSGYDESRGTVSQEVNSVYFDNDTFDFYRNRVARLEGASLIRFRWYGEAPGGNSGNYVYAEEKIHHEKEESGMSSTKDRFRLKEDLVTSFIKGQYDETDEFKEKYPVFDDIKFKVVLNNLKPKIRTQYFRTAFQLPGFDKVRCSLDTDLCMIRETCAENEWYTPFDRIREYDICRFPFAVLEIKVDQDVLSSGDLPVWVQELLNSDMLMIPQKFSKYLHGAAMLYPESVPQIPAWIDEWPEMFTPAAESALAKPRDAPSLPVRKRDIAGDSRRSSDQGPSMMMSGVNWSQASAAGETTVGNDDTDDEDDGRRLLGSDVGTDSAGPTQQPDVAIDIQQKPNGERRAAAAAAAPGVTAVAAGAALVEVASQKPRKGPQVVPLVTPASTGWKDRVQGSIGKNINLSKGQLSAKRVTIAEARSFMSVERTFLKWLTIVVLMMSIGVALIASSPDSFVPGLLLNGCALFLLFYALVKFYLRGSALRGSRVEDFYDRWGPIFITLALLAGMVGSIAYAVIRNQDVNRGQSQPGPFR